MTLPTVVSTNDEVLNLNQTSHTVTLSTNAERELMIVIACATASGAMSMSGWETLIDTAASSDDVKVFYKVSTGGESTATITLTTAERVSYQVIVLKDWERITVSTTATAFNNDPDPPAYDPPWVDADTMLIAVCACTNKTVSSGPSGYTDLISTGTTTRPCVGSARKTTDGSNEDPGDFTLSGNRTWVAFTIAIQGTLPCGLGDELFWSCPTIDSADGLADWSKNGPALAIGGGNPTIEAETGHGGTHVHRFDTDNDDWLSRTWDGTFNFSGSFSIAFWMKTSNLGSQRGLVSYGTSAGANGFHIFISATNVIDAEFHNGSRQILTSAALSADTWYHVTMVYDSAASEQRLFVNGTETNKTTTGTMTANTSRDLSIGCFYGNGTLEFDGDIDDVRIYDRALTDREVAYLEGAVGELDHPLIRDVSAFVEHTAATTHSITMVDTYLEGDFILVLEGTHNTGNWSEDSGDYTDSHTGHLSGSTWEWHILYKEADATESDIGMTGTLLGDMAARVFSIHNAKSIEHAVGVDTPDPPSLTPGYDQNKSLWIAHYMRSSTSAGTNAPTGFTNLFQSPNQEFAYAHAEKVENTATQDPDTMKAGELYSDTITLGIEPICGEAATGGPVDVEAGAGAGEGAGASPTEHAGLHLTIAEDGLPKNPIDLPPGLAIGTTIVLTNGSGSGEGHEPSVGMSVSVEPAAGAGEGTGHNVGSIIGKTLSLLNGQSEGAGLAPSLLIGHDLLVGVGASEGTGWPPNIQFAIPVESPIDITQQSLSTSHAVGRLRVSRCKGRLRTASAIAKLKT